MGDNYIGISIYLQADGVSVSADMQAKAVSEPLKGPSYASRILRANSYARYMTFRIRRHSS
jgi:hypothetical protein